MSIITKTLQVFWLFTVMFFIIASCRHNAGTSEETQEVITPVTITPVMVKTVTSTVSMPAVSTFMKKSIVRATTTGKIEKISAVRGDYISKQQLLFTIITREAEAMAKASGNDSTLNFSGRININSSGEGVLSSISYQTGDFVQEGDELAVISEQSSLVFLLDVPFESEKLVEKNKKCTVILPDNRKIGGTIAGRLPEMIMETQTIRYIVKLSATDRLPANLIATVNLVKSVNENAQVLAREAVLSNETQSEFWVMKLINDSTAVKVSISKGFENNEEVEITSPAFHPSDRIILTGNYGLPDTARIVVKTE